MPKIPEIICPYCNETIQLWESAFNTEARIFALGMILGFILAFIGRSKHEGKSKDGSD